MDYLAKKHFHEKDQFIKFDEGPHIYTINGDSDYMSVTTWVHSHFNKFDADLIIDKMMRGRNWMYSNYYGMDKEEIKQQWADLGKAASEAGTRLHYNIECFYNKIDITDDSIEYKFFKEFVKDYQHLKPFRTEWMIYDEEIKLAGSVDMLFKNDDGTLDIYDWKRSKNIKRENPWQSALTKCIEHIPDSNFWHYCLQLNTYKTILEKNYGVKIRDMYIVCLHPNNINKSYQRIKINDLSTELSDLFNLRKKQLKTI